MAALSDDQKAQVRLALGYPDGWRYRNTRLESVMDNVSSEALTLLTAILTSLTSIEMQILTAASIAAQGVKRVDEITFFDPVGRVTIGFTSAQEAAKYLVNRISIILGTPINADAYGRDGYPGDDFSPGGWPSGGGINLG